MTAPLKIPNRIPDTEVHPYDEVLKKINMLIQFCHDSRVVMRDQQKIIKNQQHFISLHDDILAELGEAMPAEQAKKPNGFKKWLRNLLAD